MADFQRWARARSEAIAEKLVEGKLTKEKNMNNYVSCKPYLEADPRRVEDTSCGPDGEKTLEPGVKDRSIRAESENALRNISPGNKPESIRDTLEQGEKMKRIYIAGPMRGIPELNFPEFYRVEAVWQRRGWAVVNPAQMDKEHGFVPTKEQTVFANLSIEQAMSRDLPAVSSCDAIALMTGWEKSQGANMELKHAIDGGKEVYDANTGERVNWKPVTK